MKKARRVDCLINSPQRYDSRHTDHVTKRNDGRKCRATTLQDKLLHASVSKRELV